MLQVTFEQLHLWLVSFLWPFTRLTGFLLVSPLWGHPSVPKEVKLALAALISMLLAPGLPPLPDVPLMSWAGFGVLVEQLLVGIAMGLVIRVMLSTVQAAGDFIGLQMGLAFATFVSPDTGANTMILARLLYMITLLMFLAVNGHLIVIDILASSFHTLPIGLLGLNPDGFILLVRFGGTLFVSGLLLALPLVASLLIINLTLGILNRSAPQLTVFSVGFPTSLTVGIFLLTVLMTDLGRFLQGLFEQGLTMMESVIQALAPLG